MSIPPIFPSLPDLIKEPDDVKDIEVDKEMNIEDVTLYYQDVNPSIKSTDEKIQEHVKELEKFFNVKQPESEK